MWHQCKVQTGEVNWMLLVYRQYFKTFDKEIMQQENVDTEGIKGLAWKYSSIWSQGDDEELAIKAERRQLERQKETQEGLYP